MCSTCNRIRKLLRRTEKKVGEVYGQDDVDTDIIRSLKAMFYEEAQKLLKEE